MRDDSKTRAIFAATMYGIAEDFGGTMTENNLSVRFKALQEYSIDQITAAGTWLLKHRTEKFPAVPTTKEFIDVIEGFEKPKISVESQAEIQAASVLKHLRYYGRVWNPNFKDPITQRLMTEVWPWSRWASELKEDQETWWKKEFIKLYKAYNETEQAEILTLAAPKGKIIGIADVKKLAEKSVKRMEI